MGGNNMRIKPVNLLPLIVIIAASIMTYRLYFREQETITSIYYGEVKRESFDISAKVSGEIIEIYVGEGEGINEEQLVAKIDDTLVQFAYEKATESHKIVETKEDIIYEPVKQEEIDIQKHLIEQLNAQRKGIVSSMNKVTSLRQQLEVTLATLEQNLLLKAQHYNDIKALYEAGIETENNYKNADLSLQEATQKVDNQKLQIQNSYNDTQQYRSQLESLDFQIAGAKERLTLIESGSDDNEKEIAGYEGSIASIDVEELKYRLEQHEVKSSYEGIVFSINYHKGEVINAGTPIITAYRSDLLEVSFYINEKDLSEVVLNDGLMLKTVQGDGEVYKGIVSYISNEALYTPSNIITTEDREKLVYEIKCTLEPTQALKDGMLLMVDLER